MLFEGGWSVGDLGTTENRVAFQLALIRLQMHLEDTFHQLAKATAEPAVLLCDRGCMDGSAYIAKDEWDAVLSTIKCSNVDLRDSR